MHVSSSTKSATLPLMRMFPLLAPAVLSPCISTPAMMCCTRNTPILREIASLFRLSDRAFTTTWISEDMSVLGGERCGSPPLITGRLAASVVAAAPEAVGSASSRVAAGC